MPKVNRPEYWEAKIQLRPYNEEVFRFIQNRVKERRDVTIANIEELKTGIDIYISDQQFARQLGKKLKDNFGGELKITRKLFGMNRQKSRLVYRGTILFRLKEK